MEGLARKPSLPSMLEEFGYLGNYRTSDTEGIIQESNHMNWIQGRYLYIREGTTAQLLELEL